MRGRDVRRGAAVVAVSVLALVGCSDDDDGGNLRTTTTEDPTVSSSSPTSAPGPTSDAGNSGDGEGGSGSTVPGAVPGQDDEQIDPEGRDAGGEGDDSGTGGEIDPPDSDEQG